MSRARGFVLVAALLVLPWSGRLAPPASADVVDPVLWEAAGVTRLETAAPAPPVVLDDLEGQRVDLKGLRGRLVMLYFWATW
jgi:hypothetical protein